MLQIDHQFISWDKAFNLIQKRFLFYDIKNKKKTACSIIFENLILNHILDFHRPAKIPST